MGARAKLSTTEEERKQREKEYQRRYRASEKGKKNGERYRKSEKGKATRRQYYERKGKAAQKRRYMEKREKRIREDPLFGRRRRLDFSGVLQIDGITFAKDGRYDEYFKKACESNDRRESRELIWKASRYLRVAKIKPLSEYAPDEKE